MSQSFPWDQIITGVVTLSLSGIIAWVLDRRKERKSNEERLKGLYKHIIDELSSSRKKDELTTSNFDSFIKENRHLFEEDFKRNMPNSFEAIWNDYEAPNSGEGNSVRNFFYSLDGRWGISMIDEKLSESNYWFDNEENMNGWKKTAMGALKRYNELSNDNMQITQWKLELIPGQFYWVPEEI